MGKLDGKIALITGGTSGIGAATAALFVAKGARVIITGPTDKSVQNARGLLPEAEVVRCDAADVASTLGMMQDIGERYRRIDILFVNACIALIGALGTLSPGPTDTPFFDRINLSPSEVEALEERFRTTIPLRRKGRADEIAAAALYLESNDSSYVTGSEFFVDGGIRL